MTRAVSVDDRIQHLIEGALPGARILRVTALGADLPVSGATRKSAGYGVPLRIDLQHGGAEKSVVLHTALANGFGHDRRADRAAEALLLADTADGIENHVRVLDVGAFRREAELVSLRNTGEFYVLTEWGEGAPYANDLRHLGDLSMASARDVARARALAEYLARLHEKPIERPYAKTRAERDLLGSGEGIFGIVDSYPGNVPAAPRERLKRIEELCLDWRWRLKELGRPLVRTHGDFHPFNVLFDDRDRLILLDTSRGSCGDAADDVTCMAINYVFFALERKATWKPGFEPLWDTFWTTYLGSSGRAVLDSAAPNFAWRGLVLASPVWYPALAPEARDALLGFVEAALEAPRFDPSHARRIFA